MPIDLIGTGIDVAQDVAGDVIGMITQKRREERAMTNQEKLMGIQTANQMKLNEQGQQLQLDTWNKTNYNAQVEQLKKAGLNPALLYGKGGAGGATTGSQGGGSAAGGSAPAPQQAFMGIEAVQFAKLAAETKLLEAQAKQAEANANKTAGVDTQAALTGIQEAGYRMTNLEANTAKAKTEAAYNEAATAYKKIETDYLAQTLEESLNQIKLNNQKLVEEIRLRSTEANVAEETQETEIAQIKKAAVEQSLRIALLKENVIKTQAEVSRYQAEVQKWSTEIVQRWSSMNQDQQQIELNKMMNDFNTSLPMKIGQWTGIIGNILSGTKDITLPSIGRKPMF